MSIGKHKIAARADRRGTIEMIAHCLYHQTPRHQRGRCSECGKDLHTVGDTSYCSRCMRMRDPGRCPICVGRPWR